MSDTCPNCGAPPFVRQPDQPGTYFVWACGFIDDEGETQNSVMCAYTAGLLQRAERAEAEQVRLMDAFNLQRKKRSEAEAERDRYRKERDHTRAASKRWREVAEDAVAEAAHLRKRADHLQGDRERLRSRAFLWSRETSVDPVGWSEDNPAWGQCVPTSLVVQDMYGGELLRCETQGGSHYWNRLPSGAEVDYTAGQWPAPIERTNIETRERADLLANPDTRRRYEALTCG